jgi:hypothetical protein
MNSVPETLASPGPSVTQRVGALSHSRRQLSANAAIAASRVSA